MASLATCETDFHPSPKDRLSSAVTYHSALRIFWAPSRLASPVTEDILLLLQAAVSCPRLLHLVRYLDLALLLRTGAVSPTCSNVLTKIQPDEVVMPSQCWQRAKQALMNPPAGDPLCLLWLFRRRFHIKVKSGSLTALMPLVVSLKSRCCGQLMLCKSLLGQGPLTQDTYE